MRVGICQFDVAWEDKEKNKAKILKLLKSHKMRNIDWLIFPETTLTGFSMNKQRTYLCKADFDFFRKLTLDCSIFVSYGGIIKNKNSFVTLDKKGNTINIYSKIHLFSPLAENKFYKAGKKIMSFKIENFTVVPTICYDLRFSYLFWSKALDTDVYVIIANWPAIRREHWLTLLRARAIENQAYVIGINRIGKDPFVSYRGDSSVIDPCGNKILDCSNNEGIFTIDLDKKIITNMRRKFPFLKDRIKGAK